MAKYAKTKGKQNNVEEVEAEADKSALEYLEEQLDKKELDAKINTMVEEFGGILSPEGAMHIIARELGWAPTFTRRPPAEISLISEDYLRGKSETVKEVESEDGKTTTYVGTWGTFIAIPISISELLTSSRGDNYVVVNLIGGDLKEPVPLFLWREKALFKDKITVNTPTIFRSVLIKPNDRGGYRLSAAHYFNVEEYTPTEEGE